MEPGGREQDITSAGMARRAGPVHGPRPVSTLVPALARQAFRRNGPANAQIMLDWPAIVGPALAAVTDPRRLIGGTLTIACSGPIAMELQHMAIELMDRINTSLGSGSVRALRFVQISVTGSLRAPPRPAPPPRAVEAARKAVADLPEGPLRDALQALGGAVLAPRKARPAR